ncbi:rubrerythrin-like domain-containing protein [Salarchaeum sp. JOR-1]|nr:rubrerythrin-like domain-containing protein [Salarchaeum sp. JOR-1]QDX39411.1 rubrerythrin-like domain-containing protein [Salarchaeum sp. JOR-1]
MRDADPSQTDETAYECFDCGNIVVADTHPGNCPDCSGPLRNRHLPLE